MAARIEFFCEFASPYGYLAATRIDALAARHGRALAFRPVLLGPIFRRTGAIPLVEMPIKGDYVARDVARAARAIGEPLGWPAGQPTTGLYAARGFYALLPDDPAAARALYMACYRRYWVEAIESASAGAVAEMAETLELDGAKLLAAMGSDAVKQRVRDANDAALAKGVFGSPFVIVDGEPFWGFDRFGEVERWLETGGW